MPKTFSAVSLPTDLPLDLSESLEPKWTIHKRGYAFRVVQENLGPNREMKRFNDKTRRQRRKKYIANIKRLIKKEVTNVEQ